MSNETVVLLEMDSRVVSIPENVMFQQLEGEVVLLDVSSGLYYGLNELGSSIWTLLQEGASTKDILVALQDKYDVSAQRLERDIRDFLTDLIAKGLILVQHEDNA